MEHGSSSQDPECTRDIQKNLLASYRLSHIPCQHVGREPADAGSGSPFVHRTLKQKYMFEKRLAKPEQNKILSREIEMVFP